MKADRFESILVWQKAQDLAVLIYQVFKSSKDFGFRDQIQRAAISISNNIAEGFERRGDVELKRFLFIAKGSCGEVRSMLYISNRLGYLSDKQGKDCVEKTLEISRMLSGFIKAL